MRRLIRQLIENMTYRDLSGRRWPRRYVVAAGLLFLAMIPTACRSAHERSQVMTAVYATPAPPATPWPTRTPTPPPTPTPTPVVDEAGCPADPKEWTLEPIVIAPGAKPLDLFQIRPDCVYRGLARSVAAIMLTEAGWKIPEVVEALGMPRFPVRYHPVITVTFEYTLRMRGEPLVFKQDWGVAVGAARFCPPGGDGTHCPRIWRVTADGSISYPRALRGCFYPRHLSAGRMVDWGMPYPVICAVRKLIPPGHGIATVEGTEDRFHRARLGDDQWNYYEEFYGYDPTLREWLMIGIHAYYTLPPEVLEFLRTEGQQELKSLAARHGLPVWDQAWLEAFTGLKPKPLPEGWQAWPDSPEFLAKYPAQVFPGYDPTKEWAR
jgi:hypothetical protein